MLQIEEQNMQPLAGFKQARLQRRQNLDSRRRDPTFAASIGESKNNTK